MWPFSSSPSTTPAAAAVGTNAAASSSSSAEDKCPVSDETRRQWLAAARARTTDASEQPPPPPSSSSPHQPPAAAATTPLVTTTTTPAPAVEACPVDESTRLRWLASQQQRASDPANGGSPPRSPFAAVAATSSSSSSSSPPPGGPPTPPSATAPIVPAAGAGGLSTTREVSSIPRVSSADLPQLAEHADTAAFYTPDKTNWVYPSESQFFAAMERKQHRPKAGDMKTLVPIHNAVNEEAWRAVRLWEQGRGGDDCGGVKLKTFKGTPGAWTPKSLANRFLFGYQAPFDTHRWLVSRCGQEVEYIIDFYAGKNADFGFHLDVRPALGSWEGWKTRFLGPGPGPGTEPAGSRGGR